MTASVATLPKQVARVQRNACVGACALVLLTTPLYAAGTGVFWSAVWGMACYVLPAVTARSLAWRRESPGAGRLMFASMMKLLGAGALLAVVLGATGALPKVVVGAFVVCALCGPMIAAAVVADADRKVLRQHSSAGRVAASERSGTVTFESVM